jgi:hypothetical protein
MKQDLVMSRQGYKYGPGSASEGDVVLILPPIGTAKSSTGCIEAGSARVVDRRVDV